MIKRLFKTGNSVVISLPREVLDSLGVKNGENVNLELDQKRHRLIVSPLKKDQAVKSLDEDFARQVNDFIEKYKPALDELAK
ncbi:MAG: AbrB/MazE/SpoVT family DNA-binding domain-containing protein [Anaerolineae bacterium]|jgi:putative addiction module antidote|nr:AbrB/MazE/SpoVT family DNA-binding domain-containing protein [Anaerolineae bacterium]